MCVPGPCECPWEWLEELLAPSEEPDDDVDPDELDEVPPESDEPDEPDEEPDPESEEPEPEEPESEELDDEPVSAPALEVSLGFHVEPFLSPLLSVL